jgi:hypothetical protein
MSSLLKARCPTSHLMIWLRLIDRAFCGFMWMWTARDRALEI